jgi:hypothetical protein
MTPSDALTSHDDTTRAQLPELAVRLLLSKPSAPKPLTEPDLTPAAESIEGISSISHTSSRDGTGSNSTPPGLGPPSRQNDPEKGSGEPFKASRKQPPMKPPSLKTPPVAQNHLQIWSHGLRHKKAPSTLILPRLPVEIPAPLTRRKRQVRKMWSLWSKAHLAVLWGPLRFHPTRPIPSPQDSTGWGAFTPRWSRLCLRSSPQARTSCFSRSSSTYLIRSWTALDQMNV